MNTATMECLKTSHFTDTIEQVRLGGRWLGWIEHGEGALTDRYHVYAFHKGRCPKDRNLFPYSREEALDVLVETSASYDARRASTKVKRFPRYSR